MVGRTLHMGRKNYSYIRVNRRRWGLTQGELALLVGLSGAAAISRIERARQVPTAQAVIGCTLVFGIPSPDLLPTFHRDVEDTIAAAAETLITALSDCTDQRSERVRSLLNEVLARLTSSNQTPRV
jgi:transcriptional regulator with XRE-family HTH domain